MQYTEIFSGVENLKFLYNVLDIFIIFAQNIELEGSNYVLDALTRLQMFTNYVSAFCLMHVL